ncbi:membrane protein [Salmonella enterica subsp. enterica]|uniref:Membrane protein n=1 Tax=Salmonella enterica I TaxID=59201 RepID=A0A447N8U6_SALET|nr:membrane protein [Salmonella enterica subsp. enterica]
MVSALYAVLGALLLMKFSFNVVRLRMQYRVAYGDGGFSELQSAIRIHGNAVEYIPVALVLLLFYGNERRRNVDGAYLRHHFNRRSADALLRFSPPPVPLAAGGDERDLVRIVADGAGKPVVYALGVGFLPVLAHNTRLYFSRMYTLCLTVTRFFLRLSPVSATGLLMNE